MNEWELSWILNKKGYNLEELTKVRQFGSEDHRALPGTF